MGLTWAIKDIRKSWIAVFLIVLLGIVYLAGLAVTVMDIDAAVYASISREMAETKSFLVVKLGQKDWLDKPPLLFWLSSLSIAVFGISSIAFKLPTILFSILGVYSTYRLGCLLYNKKVGMLSGWMLATAAAFIFINNDVRTDTILTGSVIFCLWQISEFLKTRRLLNYCLGILGCALAMLAKGPIGLMIPVLALATDFIWKRDWKQFFAWYWYLGIILVLILISPMVFGLYKQFGWNGVKFYFWTQSFGRITGSSNWKDDSGYLFFVTTFLWAYLPWSFLAYLAIGAKIVTIIKRRFSPSSSSELLTFGGVLFPFIALSFSQYKLPHYIYIVFPLCSILTSNYLISFISDATRTKTYRICFSIQAISNLLIWCSVVVILTLVFPTANLLWWLVVFVLFICAGYFSLSSRPSRIKKLIIPSSIAVIGTFLVLNLYFFPKLLQYQSGSTAANILIKKQIPLSKVARFGVHKDSFSFYFGHTKNYRHIDELKEKNKRENGLWIYTSPEGYDKIKAAGMRIAEAIYLDHFHVTMLTPEFLMEKTRHKVTQKKVLLKTLN